MSTSLIEAPTIAETRSPALLVSSSVMVVSVGVPLLSSTGASLTAVAVMLAVSVAVLKAVVPPLVLAVDFGALRAAGLIPGSVGDRGRVGIQSYRARIAVGRRLAAARRSCRPRRRRRPKSIRCRSSTARCRCCCRPP